MEILVPALRLELYSYIVYLLLTRLMGNFIDIAHHKIRTTANFYANNKILTDMPLNNVKVTKVAANLYNINIGDSNYLQLIHLN
jgi:hypothetical protein